MSKQPKPDNNRELLRYAGLGTQMFVFIGMAVFGGYKLDGWLKFKTPLLVWILPLLLIVLMIYKLAKETSKRKQDNEPKKV